MKRILVPTERAEDWKRLLAEPEKHWKPGRSAMCVAESWEAAHPGLPREVALALQGADDPHLADLELLLALPEWKVDLPGRGNPTQTDVMAICRNEVGLVVVAVEAKVSEAFGSTVVHKRSGASAGQLARISFLKDLLGLSGKATGALRYQLLHRTAAAVLTARAFHADTAVMLVQSFGKEASLRGDYEVFVGAMGAPNADCVVRVPGLEMPRLFVGWVDDETTYRNRG